MIQKVKTARRGESKKHASRPPAKLERTTFTTSRVMDFFSEKELITQTGHGREEWPLVLVKELIDNALDACEESAVPPVIEVQCDAAGIAVADNGPGLPEPLLLKQMDFGVRASNREAYVAPTRGAQGNALKTILPMPSVVDADGGRLIVEAHDKRHVIRCRVDQISQQPVIDHGIEDVNAKGTTIRIEWQPIHANGVPAWPFAGWRFDSQCKIPQPKPQQLCTLVTGYAVFNPHATIRLNWFGEVTEYAATNPTFDKWRPCQPTSSHWYEQRHIERLIGAYITYDTSAGRDRLVSEFIAEFDGLSGSLKRSKVLDACALKRVHLSALATGGRFDSARIAGLLAAMKAHTKPVKPRRLGVIGEEHFRRRFESMGCNPKSIRYRRAMPKRGMPYVVETAFAMRDGDQPRMIVTGANWSSAIKNPFRSFGSTGEGLETVLANARAGGGEPILLAVHLAHPRVEYTNRGKSEMVLNDQGDDTEVEE